MQLKRSVGDVRRVSGPYRLDGVDEHAGAFALDGNGVRTTYEGEDLRECGRLHRLGGVGEDERDGVECWVMLGMKSANMILKGKLVWQQLTVGIAYVLSYSNCSNLYELDHVELVTPYLTRRQ